MRIIKLNIINVIFTLFIAQEKLDDSMVEKLIARMIKNIHVEIKRIHVRYEDHVTFKDHPFSFGFTLNTFVLESCTSTWSTTDSMKDMYAIPQIYKVNDRYN